jgi:hypothetical protein
LRTDAVRKRKGDLGSTSLRGASAPLNSNTVCGVALNRYLTPVFCRKLFHGGRVAIAASACLALLTFPARATSVLAPRFEALVDRADLIFAGRVTSQHSEWRSLNGQKAIVTLVSFSVERTHKGRADSAVTLQFLGGRVGQVTMDVAEMPQFKTGERVVLFVEDNGNAASPVIGFFYGRFSLRKDGNGRDTVLQHDGAPLVDVAEIGRGKSAGGATRRALSHEEFAAKVHERLTRQK